jgi:hypothetical protein
MGRVGKRFLEHGFWYLGGEGCGWTECGSKKKPGVTGLFSDSKVLLFFGFFLLLGLHRFVKLRSGNGFFFSDSGIGDSVLHDSTLLDG